MLELTKAGPTWKRPGQELVVGGCLPKKRKPPLVSMLRPRNQPSIQLLENNRALQKFPFLLQSFQVEVVALLNKVGVANPPKSLETTVPLALMRSLQPKHA